MDIYHLIHGSVSSCGCYRKEQTTKKAKSRREEEGFPALKSIIRAYKTKAKERNLEFSLCFEDFYELVTSNCYYCNNPPINMATTSTKHKFVYNGIDRVDSNLGYIISNVVPCCRKCNVAKLHYSYNDFIDWIKHAYINLVKKGIINED